MTRLAYAAHAGWRLTEIQFNRMDTRTPRHLRERADKLRDEANRELDDRRRQQLRNLAADLDRQAQQASRPRG